MRSTYVMAMLCSTLPSMDAYACQEAAPDAGLPYFPSSNLCLLSISRSDSAGVQEAPDLCALHKTHQSYCSAFPLHKAMPAVHARGGRTACTTAKQCNAKVLAFSHEASQLRFGKQCWQMIAHVDSRCAANTWQTFLPDTTEPGVAPQSGRRRHGGGVIPASWGAGFS